MGEKLQKICIAIWIASAIILLLLAISSCNFIEVKIAQTVISDMGDGTTDSYSKNDALTDEEALNLEAELIK